MNEYVDEGGETWRRGPLKGFVKDSNDNLFFLVDNELCRMEFSPGVGYGIGMYDEPGKFSLNGTEYETYARAAIKHLWS